MPYIKKDDGRREALQNREPALLAGELNYQIFYYVKHYDFRKMDKKYNYTFTAQIAGFVSNFVGHKANYQRYNDMTGVLVRCKKEIYRRLHIDVEEYFDEILNYYDREIAKYEDIKINENGDVE